jgi:molybdopterin-guanine dinucleotide biosynthesis protein A
MAQRTAAIVLAGGRSSRMGTEKALLPLAGRPLVAHVIARLRPQVADVFLSVNGEAARFAAFGCATIADALTDHRGGPLAGVAAGLRHAQSRGFTYLASAPCDAPFLSLDLVARLAAAITERSAPIAVAHSPRGLEPRFALWRVDLAAVAEAALAAGEGSPRDLMGRLGASEVHFAESDSFANLNTPEDFAIAAARFA